MNKQKILQKNGLKSTSARLAVLDYLEKKKRPVDVLTIIENIEDAPDQATVYRILNIFFDKGLIERIEFGEGKYRYELSEHHHHHLICSECGRIEEVSGMHLKRFEDEIRRDGFLIKSHSLEFFGICKNCQH